MLSADALVISPLKQDLPRRRLQQAGDGVQGSGLARAVGPDQRHSLVGPDLQGDAVHRRDSAVADHEILYLQHQTALPRYA